MQAGDPIPKSQAPDSVYGFSTAKYDIRMRVRFPAPYEGKRLSMYHAADPTREDCLSVATGTSGCIDRFVGALAVVSFDVIHAGNGKPAAGSIRELVTVVEQSAGLPSRPPFPMTIKLTGGTATDVQAFGYDENPLPVTSRAGEREVAKTAWRRYRQELYLDNGPQPFAVVEWLHTITHIQVLSVEAPPIQRRTSAFTGTHPADGPSRNGSSTGAGRSPRRQLLLNPAL